MGATTPPNLVKIRGPLPDRGSLFPGFCHKEIKARRKGRRYVRLLIGTKSSPSEASSVLKQVIAISARWRTVSVFVDLFVGFMIYVIL